MTFLPAIGLLVAAAAGPAEIEHRARIEHSSGPVDAEYRARVNVAHRQIGAVAPGGRPSTLRCLWSASVSVDRTAYHPSGTSFARSMDGGVAMEGQRAGWCDTHRQSIAREIATRAAKFRAHVEVLAAEDHATIRDELDRAATRTG